ncbi:collagen alpha-1(III) chain-like [Corvus hawaiiensis]|uniref:collagen alpha-1(III) chain-like n=1 Tax=Corvus hawaiiensis TaxID=134902 RepID=UPI00201922B4|nr:collagen alpha-1(III) chain-like [Corvus hawaiiensis]
MGSGRGGRCARTGIPGGVRGEGVRDPPAGESGGDRIPRLEGGRRRRRRRRRGRKGPGRRAEAGSPHMPCAAGQLQSPPPPGSRNRVGPSAGGPGGASPAPGSHPGASELSPPSFFSLPPTTPGQTMEGEFGGPGPIPARQRLHIPGHPGCRHSTGHPGLLPCYRPHRPPPRPRRRGCSRGPGCRHGTEQPGLAALRPQAARLLPASSGQLRPSARSRPQAAAAPACSGQLRPFRGSRPGRHRQLRSRLRGEREPAQTPPGMQEDGWDCGVTQLGGLWTPPRLTAWERPKSGGFSRLFIWKGKQEI